MNKFNKEDIAVAMEKDPAATSKWVVYFTYAGVKALRYHRRAHRLYMKGHKLIARVISQRSRKKTGIEIHPAAVIGRRVFIDHGAGVVIGETAVVGDDVTIYQGVTLGGTGKEVGKRHPNIGNNVMLSAGSKILGPITIGDYSKVGAGSVVLKDVPPHSTVVGVPGRIVRMHGEKISDLNQTLPDPMLEEIARLNKRIATLEDALNIKACRYSISMDMSEQNKLFNAKTEKEEDKK